MSWIHRPNHPLANENGMVEKHLVYSARPSVVGVITDNIDAINHADGKRYTSKAKFRAATKAAGCIEIGNEKIPERKPIKLDRYQRREQIRQAIYELRNR